MNAPANDSGVIPHPNATRPPEPAPRPAEPCPCPHVTDWEPGHRRVTYTQHAANCPVGQALYEGVNG